MSSLDQLFHLSFLVRSSDGSLTVVLSAVVGKRTHWARVLSSLQILSFLPPTTTDHLRLTLTPTTAWADTAPTLATGTEPTYRPNKNYASAKQELAADSPASRPHSRKTTAPTS
ncbi:hypothetical protein LI410_mgp073 (mitochondrion) [Apium graveolens]|uniref:hypothetical protein n=1 Tax=Apium graveolens TaxID=4045 RepID=UPI001D0354A0|nr:hypothetical protein LI410_mgp073 [Apium graveolens]QVJ97910.1 hypothetical protein [Apium graveolens]QVJ98040.1 hypothetical protein [Apium graveolens]